MVLSGLVLVGQIPSRITAGQEHSNWSCLGWVWNWLSWDEEQIFLHN